MDPIWISVGANIILAVFLFLLNRTNSDQERRLKAVEDAAKELHSSVHEMQVQLPDKFYNKTDIDKFMDGIHHALRELDKKLDKLLDLLFKRA